jgi:hypothetical protein
MEGSVKSIWKFPISVEATPSVQMPTGARLLSVQVQKNALVLWALVDTKAPKVTRQFVMTATGHGAGSVESLPFVGTFQALSPKGRILATHIFDAGERASC